MSLRYARIDDAMETYRYGTVWRMFGVFPILLAVAFPILMAINGEAFNFSTVFMFVAFAMSGIWSCLYFANYSVTIAPESVTVRRFVRRPHVIKWHEVRAVRRGKHEIRFETTDHRHITISIYFPGYSAVESAAGQNLSDVVFGRVDRQPSIEGQMANPHNRQLLANRRLWLRASYLNVGGALLPGVAALLADLALERLDFGRTASNDAATIVFFLKLAVSWGYKVSFTFAFFGIVTFIMYLQAAVRFRRSSPAA